MGWGGRHVTVQGYAGLSRKATTLVSCLVMGPLLSSAQVRKSTHETFWCRSLQEWRLEAYLFTS